MSPSVDKYLVYLEMPKVRVFIVLMARRSIKEGRIHFKAYHVGQPTFKVRPFNKCFDAFVRKIRFVPFNGVLKYFNSCEYPIKISRSFSSAVNNQRGSTRCLTDQKHCSV